MIAICASKERVRARDMRGAEVFGIGPLPCAKIVLRERQCRPASRAEAFMPPSDAASIRSHHKNLGQC